MDALGTWRSVLEGLRPAFSPATFSLFVLLFDGWIRSYGRRGITACLVSTDLAERRDISAFYRFFSRGTWQPDALGRLLLQAVVALRPRARVFELVLDDTLASHKGPYVFGLGNHLDAVRSTRGTKVFCFGHVWVVLSVVLTVPFSTRRFALPVFWRLYRNEKECARNGHAYRKKTELGRELLENFVAAAQELAPGRSLQLAVDSGYANSTVLDPVPAGVTVLGAMRPDAALRDETEQKVTPAGRADAPESPWAPLRAFLYGRQQSFRVKSFVARWPHVLGTRPLRIVVVECTHGSLPLRVFFGTDSDLTAVAVLEAYAATRWPTEVLFRDLKQLFGLSDASVRVEAAVLRLAPFVGALYGLVLLWALRLELTPAHALGPRRPWYRHKANLSSEDLLALARKSLQSGDLVTWGESLAPRPRPLAKTRPRAGPAEARHAA